MQWYGWTEENDCPHKSATKCIVLDIFFFDGNSAQWRWLVGYSYPRVGWNPDPESTIYCPLSPVPCSPPQMPSSNLLFARLWLEPRTPLWACLVYLLNFPNLELFCFRNLLLFPRFSLKFVPKNVSRDNLSYWITLCDQHKLSSQCFWDQVTFTYFVKVFLFKA